MAKTPLLHRFHPVVRDLLAVVVLFVSIVTCLLLFDSFARETLASVRAYIAGEGLWSKAQRDAVQSLNAYAASGDPRHYDDYRTALRVTLGDRQARIELERPQPDWERVRAGFIAGRNHPDDVEGMGRFLRRFRKVDYVARAAAAWTEGDELMARLDTLAEQIRREVSSGRPDSVRLSALLAEVGEVNRQLAPLEDEFSRALGDGARWLDRTLTAASLVFTTLLVGLGVVLSLRVAQRAVAAEEARRAADERLRIVVDASPAAIFTFDLQGRVLTWNPAAQRLFGWGEGELRGRPLPVVLEEHAREFEELCRRIAQGESFTGVELKQRRRDGGKVDVSLSAAPLRDQRGAVCGVVALVMDVTERRRLESDLRQAQKMEAVGRLAGGVAHDFNNLLTAMTGYTELLRRTLPGPEPRRYVDEIQKAADRAASLVRQLLAFGHKQIVSPVLLDVNEVVGGIEEMLGRLLGEDVHLVVRLGPETGTIRLDRGQLEQALLNLAANARDAMPGGGTLTIETGVEGVASARVSEPGGNGEPATPFVFIRVTDTGQGMDEETRAHVFEPFFTTKGMGQGTGLGLASVFAIVNQGGGRIGVDTATGRGTTFLLLLPQIGRSNVHPEMAEAAERAPRGTETILVVEDEEAVRAVMVEALRSCGYRVLEARHPGEALVIAERHPGPLDLLVTDLVMPDLGGGEVADRLRRVRPRTPVLFVSGHADDAVARHGILRARAAFLPKPFTPDQLARKVRELLDTAAPAESRASEAG